MSRKLTQMEKDIKTLQTAAKKDTQTKPTPVTFAVLENGDLSYFEISAMRVGDPG